MAKVIPQRTCIVCRLTKDKKELTRFVLSKDGNLTIDNLQKLEGRGAYVCADGDCKSKLLKTHALNRAFKKQFNDELVMRLIDESKN
ncbi:MAG: YlxR family protein [Clostridia bacterium]|nr:YlxR family protein [Clostridia bacterium]